MEASFAKSILLDAPMAVLAVDSRGMIRSSNATADAFFGGPVATGEIALDKLLEEAEALIVKAHNAQTEVIQSQVSGESMEYSLLFVHAQDTVMTITTELRMTQKLLPIVKMLLNKKGD